MGLYAVPSDEQLVNFAAVFVSKQMGAPADKAAIAHMFEASPELKREWLDRHRELQEGADRLGGA